MFATFRNDLFGIVQCLVVCYVISNASAEPHFALTSVGVIQGTEHVSPHGHPYFAFRGIPFAKPPTGDLRWKRPEPFPTFDSVYEAVNFKPGCPQNTKSVETSEDCLYLDVYVPGNVTGLYKNATEALAASAQADGSNGGSSTSGGNSRPVMIWIHGGAYHSGYSEAFTGWKVATEQNLVVVVIQYRLGALGFLSTGDEFLPGNYGLWDQLLALKWVKANIRGFGGDVTMVTIVGESAGASSVSQHTVSRHSSGLFHRAVMMSGTVEASWCIRENPRAAFDTLAELSGCGDNSTTLESRMDCLMAVSADDIHSAAVKTEAGDFVTFVPVIDNDFFPADINSLVKDEEYLSSVGFYDYDVLVGVLNNEGVIAISTLISASPSVLMTGRIPYRDVDGVVLDVVMELELGKNFGPNSKDAVNNRYFYPRDPAVSSAPVQKFFDLNTDANFVAPALRYLRDHGKRQGTSRAGLSTSSSLSSSPSSSSLPRQSSSTPSSVTSSSSASSSLLSTTPPSTSPSSSSPPEPQTSSSSSSSSPPPLPSTTTSAAQPPAPSPRPSSAYLYYFDWYPTLTRGGMVSGMPHGLDVDYLFGLTNASMMLYGAIPLGGHIDQQEHDLSRMYGDMIGAFVRTGNPNNGLSPSLNLGDEWVPYDASKETYLRFSPSPSVEQHLNPSTASLWNDLVPRLHSRWLQQTANQIAGPTANDKTTTARTSQSKEFTDFNVTEGEANTLLIALLVVAVILLVFNVCLLMMFIIMCRRKTVSKYEMTSMDRSGKKNENP